MDTVGVNELGGEGEEGVEQGEDVAREELGDCISDLAWRGTSHWGRRYE